MHPNAQLIQKFYSGFQARDAASMIACYHPNIVFTDPVFLTLRGTEAKTMWQMLCGRAKGLEITYNAIEADDVSGSAHWEARYLFSKSQRPVHNIIEAKFKFQEGQIIEHTDTFNLWRWAGMALGPTGSLLGWTPFVQAAIRKDARRGLDAFMQKQVA